MVIVRLKGGLDNQLFQYAAARRIAIEQNVPLKLDLSFLTADAVHHTKRHFELYKLKILTPKLQRHEKYKQPRKHIGETCFILS